MAETKENGTPAEAQKEETPKMETTEKEDEPAAAAVEESKEEKAEEAENPEEEEEEEDNEEKSDAKTLEYSTCVKIFGFTRSGKLDDDVKSWYKFFKDDVEVEVPLIQNPGSDDLWVIFKMKTVEDKRKLYQYIKKNKFNGNKIRVKTITFKENKSITERKSLTLEEALNILYPGRNVLYADQLKEKYSKIKTIVEENIAPIKAIEKFTKVKKYLRNLKTKEIVPLTPIDGYDTNVLVHIEKSSEGEVVFGVRVVDHSGNGNTIVPLEHCLSVPRQMTLVAKGIITGLTTAGLEAYEPIEKTGEVLALVLRITDTGTFMITVVLKKPDPVGFHELTAEGITLKEGEELGVSFRQLISQSIENAKAKLTKFYEAEKTALGIQSIFMVLAPEYVLLNQMASKVWNNLPRPEHVVGDKQILEKLNGIVLKVQWDRERHTEAFKSVLNLFDPFNFNHETTIYLVSPITQIGHYFAKKCGRVVQIGFWTADTSNKLRASAKKDNIKNIDYLNFNSRLKKPASTENSVVVWWPFLYTSSSRKNKKITFLEQFLNFKFTSMVFISYWNRATENQLQNHMEKVYSKLKINKIVPFDTEPYGDGFGLYLFFKGLLGEQAAVSNTRNVVTKKFGAFEFKKGSMVPFKKPQIPRGSFLRIKGEKRPGMPGKPITQQYAQFRRKDNIRPVVGLQTRKHISALDRLGPREPDYQSPRYMQGGPSFGNPWAQIEQVAGVVQNLQSMAQQMQTFFNKKQQQNESQEQPPEWFNKRKYPSGDGDRGTSGYPEDNWNNEGRSMNWDSNPGNDYNNLVDYHHRNKKRREEESDRNMGYSDNNWRNSSGNQYGDEPSNSQYGDGENSWRNRSSTVSAWNNGGGEPSGWSSNNSSWDSRNASSSSWGNSSSSAPASRNYY